MALIKCKYCNSNISDKAVKCPKCGNELKKVRNNKKDLFICIFSLVILGIYSIGTISNIIDTIQSYSGVYNSFWDGGNGMFLLQSILLSLFFILFLWFIFASYKFQKKAFNIISLVFLILYLLFDIIVNFSYLKEGIHNNFLIDFLFNINAYNNIEILPMILLYLFCKKDK